MNVSDIEALLAQQEHEIERLRAELTHWKANHDNRVRAARVLIERTDMPFERTRAYQEYIALQAEIEELRHQLAAAGTRCRHCGADSA